MSSNQRVSDLLKHVYKTTYRSLALVFSTSKRFPLLGNRRAEESRPRVSNEFGTNLYLPLFEGGSHYPSRYFFGLFFALQTNRGKRKELIAVLFLVYGF
jgi:hypothetical protein